MTNDSAPSTGDAFAQQLRHYRDARGWTRAALAERCREVGSTELTEAAIVNLERPAGPRRRRPVTIEEWLTLAVALQVPPLALLLPVGTEPEVKLVGGLVYPVDSLLWWVRSYTHSPVVAAPISAPGDDSIGARARQTIHLIAKHGELVAWLRQALQRESVDLEINQARIDALKGVRLELFGRGEIAPALPAEVSELLAREAEQHG